MNVSDNDIIVSRECDPYLGEKCMAHVSCGSWWQEWYIPCATGGIVLWLLALVLITLYCLVKRNRERCLLQKSPIPGDINPDKVRKIEVQKE